MGMRDVSHVFTLKVNAFKEKRENKGGCLNASTTRFYNDYCLYVSHYVKRMSPIVALMVIPLLLR